MTPRRPRIPATFVLTRGDPPDDRPAPVPAVDVLEDERGWRLVFELPGSQPEHLAIEVHGRTVTVRGERQPTPQEGGRFLRVERAAGFFERSLELPEEPDPERSSASYSNGLLTVEIRRQQASGRRIPIGGREGPPS